MCCGCVHARVRACVRACGQVYDTNERDDCGIDLFPPHGTQQQHSTTAIVSLYSLLFSFFFFISTTDTPKTILLAITQESLQLFFMYYWIDRFSWLQRHGREKCPPRTKGNRNWKTDRQQGERHRAGKNGGNQKVQCFCGPLGRPLLSLEDRFAGRRTTQDGRVRAAR